MNNELDKTEGEISRVLEALGGIEVPLGLEGRVLAGLGARRARRWAVGWAPGMVFAGVCIAVVVAWVSVGPVHRGAAVQEAAQSGNLVASGRMTAEEPGGPIGKDVPVKRQPRTQSGRVVRAAGAMERAAGAMERAANSEERLAVEEMRAPSRPAASLPLTEGERLLMRVAEGRGAVALAKSEPGEASGPEVQSEGAGAEVQTPSRPEAGRDVGTVLQAGLFAGMRAATDE